MEIRGLDEPTLAALLIALFLAIGFSACGDGKGDDGGDTFQQVCVDESEQSSEPSSEPGAQGDVSCQQGSGNRQGSDDDDRTCTCSDGAESVDCCNA